MKHTNAVATILAITGGLFISYVGLMYMFDPASVAKGFGFHHWPSGDADGFYTTKGIRDLTSGLVVFTLLAARQRHALAIVMAVYSIIPFGDATNVLAHHGSVATALSVHTATAITMLITSALLWIGSRRPAIVASPQPAVPASV